MPYYLSISAGQEQREEGIKGRQPYNNTAAYLPPISIPLHIPLSTPLDSLGCFVMKLSHSKVVHSQSCLKTEEGWREQQNHREEDESKTPATERPGKKWERD